MNLCIPNSLHNSEKRVLKQLLAMADIAPNSITFRIDSDEIIVRDNRSEISKLLITRQELNELSLILGRHCERYSSCIDPRIGSVRARLLKRVFNNAVINEVADRIRIAFSIKDKPSKVTLSHDVDKIRSFDKWTIARRIYKISSFILKRQLQMIPAELSRFISTRNKYNDIHEMMKMEDDYGYRSTFYFLIGRGGRYGARYSLNDVKSIMIEMDKYGWEVGLHLNYYSWHDEERIRLEKNAIEDILGHSIKGCRVHYLHFDDETIEKMQKVGFIYDASVGFADDIAFRAGVAAPYYYFEAGDRLKYNRIVEIPISYMDCAGYQKGWNNNDCESKIRELIDRHGKNATLSFLWHTGTLCNPDYPGWGEGYRNLLNIIKENGLIVKTHEEIAHEYIEKMNYYISMQSIWEGGCDGY